MREHLEKGGKRTKSIVDWTARKGRRESIGKYLYTNIRDVGLEKTELEGVIIFPIL